MAEDANDDHSSTTDTDGEEPRRLPRWLVPALIGLVTVTAALLTWRAGQLGSSAAFQDRQSVGQTITQQEQITEAGLAVGAQASAYVSYRADLAEAAALEDLAAEASAQGLDDVAADLSEQAQRTTSSADQLAVAQGVLTAQEALRRQVESDPRDVPEGFDVAQRFDTELADVSSGVTSPGALDPDAWAARAEATRSDVRSLRHATVFMLVAVAAYTVAELARRSAIRLAGFAVGGVVYSVTLVAALPSVG